MRVFTNYLAVSQRVPRFSLWVRGFSLRVRGFVLLTVVLMSSACGNKGDLFLDGGRLFVDRVQTIEDALDELEVLEAEESVIAGKVLEDTLQGDEAGLNGNKSKE